HARSDSHLHRHYRRSYDSPIPYLTKSTLAPYTTLFRSRQRTIHHSETLAFKGPGRGALDALLRRGQRCTTIEPPPRDDQATAKRSEEHTSELQSRFELVCRRLLEKKKRT